MRLLHVQASFDALFSISSVRLLFSHRRAATRVPHTETGEQPEY